MEKMREEFEAWARESTNLWLIPVMFDGEFVNYYDEDTTEAFNIWKASRAAQCVELPKQWFDDDLECDLMVARRVEEALDAACIRYV